jgi:hypothetical protein
MTLFLLDPRFLFYLLHVSHGRRCSGKAGVFERRFHLPLTSKQRQGTKLFTLKVFFLVWYKSAGIRTPVIWQVLDGNGLFTLHRLAYHSGECLFLLAFEKSEHGLGNFLS